MQIKLNKVKRVIFGLAAFAALFLYSSCEIGLGDSVDTEAPSLKILAPETGGVLRGNINLNGTWSDDQESCRVTVSLDNVNKETTVISAANATVNADGTWDYVLYTQTSSDVPDNSTVLPDGKYEAKITAYDAAGHSSGEASRTFEIDGTAPLVALSKPASIDSTSPSTYGRSVKIKGLISDDHSVPTITVAVYTSTTDAAGNIVRGDKITLSKSEFTDFDPSDTSVTIAQYFTQDERGEDLKNLTEDEKALFNNYKAIYGDESQTDGWDTTKLFFADVTATDKAGNTNENTFLKTNMLKLVEEICGQALEMADLKNILNGSYSGSLDSSKISTVKEILNGTYDASSTYPDYKNYFANSTNNLSFSVNSNANPKYQVSGNYTYTSSSVAEDFGTSEKTGSLTIKVDAGLDGTEFKPNALSVVITKLTDDNELSTEADDIRTLTAANIYYNDVSIENNTTTTDSGTYSIKLSDISDFLNAGKCYNIKVSGADIDGNQFMAYNDNNYGFMCQVTSTPATASCEKDKTYIKASELKTSDKLTIKVENDDIDAEITVNAYVKFYDNVIKSSLPSSEFDLTTPTFTSTLNSSLATVSNGKVTYSVDIPLGFSSHELTNVYNCTAAVYLTLEKTGASTTTTTYYLYADNAEPTVTFTNGELKNPSATVYVFESGSSYNDGSTSVKGSGYYDSTTGNYTVSGKWQDVLNSVTGSGVAALYYTFDENPVNGQGNWEEIYNTGDGSGIQSVNNMWSQDLPIDSQGKKTISFYAVDAVGNQTEVITFANVIFDFAVPALTYKSGVNDEGKTILTFTGTDTYGVQDISVEVKKDGNVISSGNEYSLGALTSNEETTKSRTLTFEDGLDGTYTITATVTDKANRTTKLENIDTEAPSITNNSITDNNAADGNHYAAYKKSDSEYFINPGHGSFTLTGVASDDTGVTSVALTITAKNFKDSNRKLLTVSPDNSGNTNKYSFNFDLSSWKDSNENYDTGADAVLTVKDLAGNITSQSFTVNFDTLAPEGQHALDSNGKDLFFRLGEQDRDDGITGYDSDGNVTSANPVWDASIDKDVGGKYSSTTYGNSESITIRGTFLDKQNSSSTTEDGSGVARIYYMVTQNTPTDTYVSDFKSNYATYSYFTPITATSQKTVAQQADRRVFYEDDENSGTLYNGTSTSQAKYNTAVSPDGNITVTEGSTNKTKYYKTITSTFKASIQGFVANSQNYLYLAVVDNVGNVVVDTARVYDSSETEGYKDYAYYLINIDNIVPEVTSDNSANMMYSNGSGELTITGTASDTGAGVSKVEVYASVNGADISFPVTFPVSGSTDKWSAKIDASKLGDEGNITINVKVTDGAGTGNTKTIPAATICVDTTAPTVILTEPTDADSETDDIQINGVISFTGTISDKNVLPDIAIKGLQYVQTDSTPASNTVWTDAALYKSAEDNNGTEQLGIKVSGNYTFSISDFDTKNLEDNKTYYLRAVAKDSAGNIGYSSAQKVIVSQDSDRPVVSLSNLTLSTSGTTYLKSTTTLYGTVSDDDGVSKFEYSIDNGENWYEKGSSSWTITGLTEGSNTVLFRITDSKGKTFTSGTTDTLHISPDYSISNQPKYTDGTTKVSTGSVSLTFNVVTQSPVVKDIKYSVYNSSNNTWSDFVTTLRTLGGIYSKFKIQLSASSAQGISGITATYSVDDSSTITFTCADSSYNDTSIHVWTSSEITVGTEESLTGSQTINYIVSDNVTPEPMQTKDTLSISIDNKNPVVEIKNPTNDSQISLEQTVRGSINETSTLYYAVSRYSQDNTTDGTAYLISDVTPEATVKKSGDTILATPWTQLQDDTSSGTWYVYFDEADTNELDHTKKFATYLIEDENPDDDDYNYLGITTKAAITRKDNPYDTITPVYFWIKAVDECGNEQTAYKKYLIDPQGERPSVQITSPTNDSDGNAPKLGGTIRLQGIATDNNAAKYAWVQIDTDGDGSFELDDLTTLFNVKDSSNNKVYTIGNISENSEITSLSGITNETADDYAIMTEVKSSSWGISINANKEFNPTNGTRTLNLTVYATDEDIDNENNTTIHISLPKTQQIIIDANSPYVEESSLKLVQYNSSGNITKSQTYSTSSVPNVKGKWYLTGNFKDSDSGIKKITYNGTVVIDSATAATYTGSDTCLWFKPTLDGTLVNYQFSVPLGNSSDNTVGTDTATFEVIENTDHELSVSPSFSVNYDNKAPSFTTSGSSFVKLESNVQNSSGFYTFGAIASEDTVDNVSQSGVERIAFYFTRDLNYSLKTLNSETYAKHGDENTNDLFDVMIYHSNLEDDSTYDDVKTGNMIINYDGKVTAGDMIKEDGLYWHIVTGSISSHTFTYSGAENPNIHPNGLVKINGVIYLIKSINGTTVSIDGTLDDEASTTAYFAVCNVIDSTGEKNGLTLNYDKGYGYGYYPARTSDDGDLITETFNNQGTEWIFDAAINSKNLPDGPINLHLVAFDKAGNYRTWESRSFVVSNNAPRIAGMSYGTDENGNGEVDDDEFKTDYTGKYSLGYDSSGNAMTNVTFPIQNTSKPTTLLNVKGKTVIKPEIVGGNGSISYTYKISSYSNNTWTDEKDIITDKIPLGSGTTDEVAELENIELTVDHFIGTTDASDTNLIPDGVNKFIFSFGDSTPGETATTSISNNATLNVIMNVALRETTEAKNWIIPFYWKSTSDNSLFNQSIDNGHIEIAKDWVLSSEYSGTTGEYDSDPKVSGKIKIEGIAQDDTLLREIKVMFGTSMGGLGTSDNVIATYNSSSASWTVTALESDGSINSSTGWASAVQQATYQDLLDTGIITSLPSGVEATYKVPYTSQNYGHVVHWILYLDTSKVTGVTANDVTLQATAKNRGTPKWSTSSGSAVYTANEVKVTGNTNSGAVTKDESTITIGELTGKYQMDVVPYVTKVYTALAKQKTSNWSVYNRTALGHYPVQSVVSNIDSSISLNTKTSEDVTLYGFNLNDSSAKIISKSNTFTVGNETSSDLNIISDETKGTLTFNTAKLASGKPTISVNEIIIMNNINNNDAKGSASSEGTAYANCYNRQPNGDTNNIQTDDIEFDVWEFNDRASIPINGLAAGINMEINQKTGMLNYAFANGGLYFSMGGNIDQTVDYSDSNSYSSYYWAADYDTYASPCVGFHVDELGYTYSVDSGGDTNTSGSVDKWVLYSSRWGIEERDYLGTLNGRKSLRLEEIGLRTGDDNLDYSLMKYRFLSPEFASSVSGTSTNLYLVYYDALCNQIRFRAGTFSGTERQTPNGFTDEYTSGASSYYKTNNCQIIANGSSGGTFKTSKNATKTVTGISGRGAGQYVDVAVVKNNSDKDVVCVVWYDADANCMKYSYITDPISSWNYLKGNETAVKWSEPQSIFNEGGEYCHIVADKNNHLHIAAYAGNGDVMYAYLDNYEASASTCTVDASGSVGEHLTLDVAVSNNHSIPYIGYYTSAIKKPKYAYLVDPTVEDDKATFTQVINGVDSSERFTGTWEVAVVPTPSRMTTNREDKVNIGLWKNSGVLMNSKNGTSSYGNTVNGYSSENWSKTYGNGTSNGILGYQISTSTGSCLETAQMR